MRTQFRKLFFKFHSMDQKLLEELSKTISYYLRHKPEELQISLDPEGWTDLDGFLKLLSQSLKTHIFVEDLERFLQSSTKKRFEMKCNKIRAIY